MYKTKKNTIIFDPEFNELLYINLISKYNKIIFSDYLLNDGVFEIYENNYNQKLFYHYSRFNQKVNHLPQSITHLIFGNDFNQEVNYLPCTLTHLTFGWVFNQEVNHLPESIIHLTLGGNYNQELNQLPQSITNLTFGWRFNRELNQLPNQ
jgi:hypothetical protein